MKIKNKWNEEKKQLCQIRLIATSLTFLTFVVVNLLSDTGILCNNTVLKWDATGQYINWMAYLMDILKGNSNEVFYSLSITPGNSNALLIGWYLLSPFNLLLIFFDKNSLPDAYYWIECAKICASGLTMSIFLTRLAARKKIKLDIKKICLVLICCLGYSYSGFIAGHTHELLYFDAYLILPLLADSIIKLKCDNKTLQYYLCLTYAIVTNFYFGFMICIFSFLFYVYLSFRRNFEIKNIVLYVITSVLAAGSSLFALLPIVYQVPLSKMSGKGGQLFSITRCLFELVIVIMIMAVVYAYYVVITSAKYNKIFSGVKRYVMDMLLIGTGAVVLHQILNKLAWYGDYYNGTILFPIRMLFGVFSINDYQPSGLMSIYCGIPILILLVCYLLDYRTDSKTKLINVELIVLCYFMMGFKHLNYVWHGFTHPAGSFYRWAFFVSFMIISMVVEYAFDCSTLETISVKKLMHGHGAYVFVCALAIIGVFCIHYYRKSIYNCLNYRSIIGSFAFAICYLAIYYISKKSRVVIYAVIVLLFTAEIIANALISLEGFKFTSYAEYNSYNETMAKIRNDISENGDKDVYRVESGFKEEWYFVGEYNSIFHSSSAFTKRNRDYMMFFGMGVDDEARLLESDNNFELESHLAGALGIRYLISENELSEEEYSLIGTYLDAYSKKNYNVYYNTVSIPLVYKAPIDVIDNMTPEEGIELMESNLVPYESKVADTGLLVSGNSSYEAVIEVDEGEVVVWSIPYEDNWIVCIDGERVDLEKAYDFWLAAKISRGKHHIRIKYTQPNLLMGLLFSVLSTIAYIVLLVVKRNKIGDTK